MSDAKKIKKVVKSVANGMIYVFIILAVVGVSITLVSAKDTDGTITLFDKQMRIVLSKSMEGSDKTDVKDYDIKEIPIRSMVFIDVVPKDEAEAAKWYGDLKVGDVLTIKYVYVRQETITHRIVHIEPKAGGGYLITLEGDNKAESSETSTQVIDTTERNTPNYIIGKVTGYSLALGWFVSTLKSPAGIICVIIVPALLILVSEIFRIAKLLSEDKRKSERKEREEQKNELEELRRRLAELEGKTTAAPSVEETAPKENADNVPPENTPNG